MFIHFEPYPVLFCYLSPQQTLNELRQWLDRCSLFDNVYTTENGVFAIDCAAVHKELVPMLEDVINQVRVGLE